MATGRVIEKGNLPANTPPVVSPEEWETARQQLRRTNGGTGTTTTTPRPRLTQSGSTFSPTLRRPRESAGQRRKQNNLGDNADAVVAGPFELGSGAPLPNGGQPAILRV